MSVPVRWMLVVLGGIAWVGWSTWSRAAADADGAPQVLVTTPEPSDDASRRDDPTEDFLPAPEVRANPAAQEATVRETINRLLPKASADEREIWFEQFRSTPPGIIEDLLRLRRDMQGEPLSSMFDRGPALAPEVLVPQPLAEPVVPQTAGEAGLQAFRAMHAQNLLQARTPGYQALVPVLMLTTQDTGAGNVLKVHCPVARLNMQPGEPIETGRPLDVMIHGPGFFQVSTPDGPRYTRCGMLEFDAEHRLSLRLPAGVFPLVPEVKLPADLVRIEVAEDGQVLNCDEEPAECLARIELTQFRDPSSLAYAPEGGLIATPAAGPSRSAPPTDLVSWSLQAGALESSNVDVQHEQEQLGRADDLSDL